MVRASIAVPSEGAAKNRLIVEARSHTTTAYVNGLPAGSHDGFSTAFRFDVTDLINRARESCVLPCREC